MVRMKRKNNIESSPNILTDPKIKRQKRQDARKRKRVHDNKTLQSKIRRYCTDLDISHTYLTSSQGMVSFTPEYIQHMKETYNNRSYLGLLEYQCKYCNAVYWLREQNKTDTKKINK